MKELRRLLPYLARHKTTVTAGMLAVMAAQGVSVLGPQVLRYAVDDITVAATARKFALYGGLIVLIATVEGFFRFWMRRLLIGVSRYVELELRQDLFEHLLRMSPSFYNRWRTGDLMSRATNDIGAVRMVLGPGIMYPAETVVVTLASVAFMIAIDLKLTLISLALMPAVSVAVKKFGAAIHVRFEAIQAKMSDVSVVVQENLSGIRVLKAYAQEEAEQEKFAAENERYFQMNVGLVKVWGLFYPLIAVLIGLAAVMVLFWGGRMVTRGELTLGQLVAFFAYLSMLTWPMVAFGWVVNIFQRGAASMKRLAAILDETPDLEPSARAQRGAERSRGASGAFSPTSLGVPPTSHRGTTDETPASLAEAFGEGGGPGRAEEMSPHELIEEPSARAQRGAERSRGASVGVGPHELIDAPEATKATELSGQVELRDVSFSYNGAPILERVSLTIAPGETLAVVGRTGSGKTTLVSLIPRLYDVSEGQVLVDGVDVREIPLERLRRAIGFVPQESFLFSETLFNNVAFGRPESGKDAVASAATVAGLAGDVSDFPDRYETLVGERGITLSGGQKQRATLARALLLDPRILILDDALSSVDTETEERILTELRGVLRKRTAILVSHRISTVKDADHIIVLDHGRIVESGKHDDLLAFDGIYAGLHRKQLLEEELERI